MKNRAVLVAAAALALCPFVAAADEALPKNAISIDLALPLFTSVDYFIEDLWNVPVLIQYERVVVDNVVGVARAGVLGIYGSGGWWPVLELALGAEWHPFKPGLDGFHVDLFGLLNNEPLGEAYRYRVGIAPGLGWQLLLGPRLSLDLVLGGFGGTYTDMLPPSVPGWSLGFCFGGGGVFLGLAF
jgi:hypothetical protein